MLWTTYFKSLWILILLPLFWPSTYPIHPGFSSSPLSVSLFTSLGSGHWTHSSKTRFLDRVVCSRPVKSKNFFRWVTSLISSSLRSRVMRFTLMLSPLSRLGWKVSCRRMRVRWLASSQNTEILSILSLVIADLESVPFGVVKARPEGFVWLWSFYMRLNTKKMKKKKKRTNSNWNISQI